MSPELERSCSPVGERISRIVEPVDHEYYPPRTGQVEPPPAHHERRAATRRGLSQEMTVTPEETNERIAPEGGDSARDGSGGSGPRWASPRALAAIFMRRELRGAAPAPARPHQERGRDAALGAQARHGYIAGGVLQALALLLIAAVLWYLYRATKYRRPQTPAIALILGIAGPIVFGLAGAIGPFVIKHYAVRVRRVRRQRRRTSTPRTSSAAARRRYSASSRRPRAWRSRSR